MQTKLLLGCMGLAGMIAGCASEGQTPVSIQNPNTGGTTVTGGVLVAATGGAATTGGTTAGTGGVTASGGSTAATGGSTAETGGSTAETGGSTAVTGGTQEPGTGGEQQPETGGTETPREPSCLDGITDFDSAGPFSFERETSGSIKMWVPEVPAGCKVPVLHLANGTGGTCSAYRNVLERFASHGFLTTCYESGQTGAGTQGVMAIEAAFSMFPDLADTKIGSTGHSQGGQAAFTVLQQAEAKWGDSYTYAGLAMEPASGFGAQPPGGSWQSMYGKIKSPMFMFSGTRDSLVSASWVQRGFNALSDSVEAYNWSAVGATHIPTPQSETMQVGVPWWRWKLLGDKAACEAFKALPGGSDWNSVKEQNVADCN